MAGTQPNKSFETLFQQTGCQLAGTQPNTLFKDCFNKLVASLLATSPTLICSKIVSTNWLPACWHPAQHFVQRLFPACWHKLVASLLAPSPTLCSKIVSTNWLPACWHPAQHFVQRLFQQTGCQLAGTQPNTLFKDCFNKLVASLLAPSPTLCSKIASTNWLPACWHPAQHFVQTLFLWGAKLPNIFQTIVSTNWLPACWHPAQHIDSFNKLVASLLDPRRTL